MKKKKAIISRRPHAQLMVREALTNTGNPNAIKEKIDVYSVWQKIL